MAEPKIDVLSHFIWEPDVEGFGGLSGLEVDLNGETFIAVSDNGVLYRGRFNREKGNITAAQLIQTVPLLFETGEHPSEKRYRDIEGLALRKDDGFDVSVEGNARILSYRDSQGTPTAHSLPLTGEQMPKNTGFEALAISASGKFVALPEGSGSIRAPYTVYESNANGWTKIYDLPRHGGFRPVGTDFGPDGHLYVLTRAFNGFGFATRIERILFKDDAPITHEKLFASRFGAFDNLEGLSVWAASENDLRLYAISDDNFSRAQSTEIVEFRLKE
ncbi:esterase-like activity of phytase family protein [Planktotalea sp.]|uniref:esterase-like activity of phytase family protein n=1 Tax=Planktotalea sp. TaxID=2029877 RepID=UPI003D6AFB04